jgi:hypothetical protein
MRPIDADSLKVRLSGCMILMPNGEKCTAKRAIDTQGTIEPKVRCGRWIEVTKHRDENGTILTDYECSECCAMVKDSDAEEIESERFCYNCGAKMRATDTNVGGKGGADNA